MTGRIAGIDELRKTDGTDLLVGVGFGQTQDWEVIDRQVIVAGTATIEVAFDPTLYDELEWTLLNLVPEVDDAGGRLRVSTDGGSTFVSTTDYSWAGRRFGTTSDSRQGAGGATEIDLDGADISGNVAGENSTYKIITNDLSNAIDFSVFRYESSYANNAVGVAHFVIGTGVYEVDTVVDALQFRFDNGDVDAGVAILRGRRKISQTFGGNADWEILSTKEADNSADIRFEPTDFDVAAYDEFELNIIDMVPASDGSEFRVTVSDDGGATYEAGTQYNYVNDRWGVGSTRSLTQVTDAAFMEFMRGIGNVTDESTTVTIKMTNLSSSSLKKIFQLDATSFDSVSGALTKWESLGEFKGSAAAINGIKILLDNSGAVNITSGKFVLRGRRVLAPTVQASSGDLVHLGTFTVLSPGDTFIDVDFRTSVNPQFADFTDIDFIVSISGNIGPGNNQLEFRILRLGVAQDGSSDYKDDSSNSRSAIRMSHGTAGSGRRVQTKFVLARGNNTTDQGVFVVGESFSANSSGSVLVGSIGGHNNGLALGINDGFRIFATNDLDDLTVDVWAMRKSMV